MAQAGEEQIRVLHVDDNPELLDLAATCLEREAEALDIVTETNVSDGMATLAEVNIDCIVSDYEMPEQNGLEFLERVREQYPEIPFILFTGKGSEEIASEAISAGVTEYLQKETGTEQYTILANRITRTVTEIRAQEALEQRERLVESMRDSAYILDSNGRCQFVNEQLLETLHAERTSVVSEPDPIRDHAVDEQERETCQRLFERLQAGESDARAEVDVSFPESSVRTLDLQVTRLERDGVFDGIVGVARDITDRKEREQELETYRTLVETAGEPMYVLDDTARITLVNDAFLDGIGYARDVVVGEPVTKFMRPEDVRTGTKLLLDILGDPDRKWDRFEFVAETTDGETRRYEDSVAPLTDDDGQFIGSVGVIRDITTKERDLMRYETLIEAVSDPVYALDADGTVTMVNEATAELLGRSPEDLTGKPISDWFPDDAITAREELVDELLTDDTRSRDTYELEYTADGDEATYFEVNVAVIEDPTEEFLGTVSIARDITERKAREAELTRSRELLQQAQRLANVGAWEVNPQTSEPFDGRVTDELYRIHGLDPESEFDVETSLERYVPEDRKRVQAMFERAVEAGEGYDLEARIKTPDDERRWVRSQAEPIEEDGEVVRLRGALQDITDRKNRQEELERYETIIEAIGDPVYALDGEGNFTFVNDAFEEMTGYDAAELIDEHVTKVMSETDVERSRDLISELLDDDEMKKERYELDLVTRTDERIPCENHLALLPFTAGDFRGTAGVIRNISERKRREQQLEQFASVVSHDLRNPLTVLLGHIEPARETDNPDHIDAIEDAAHRMERLIEGLLSLAKKGESIGETEFVPVQTVASSAWEHVETGDATLSVEYTGNVPADRSRLRELFENLFRNAVQHAGADAHVRVGECDDGFFVADDGPGIPPEERERIFEYGVSHDGGTGFGLAIVENIVNGHDWDITVTESESGGARFEVTGVEP